MSSLHRHLAVVTDTRLAIVTDTAANLITQLRELNELRERVRKAELSARPTQRIDRKKECAKRGRLSWRNLAQYQCSLSVRITRLAARRPGCPHFSAARTYRHGSATTN